MANVNSTNQDASENVFRNGFKVVTVQEIERSTSVAYKQSMAMEAIFKAIGHLTSDETIMALCEQGALQAVLQGNDLDVLQECAMKAGIIGAPGVSH